MIEALKTTADKLVFYIRHETTPEIASYARTVFLFEKGLVDMMQRIGSVNEERLAEIGQDEDIQDMYFSLMKRARDGGKAAREVRSEVGMLPDDQLAGWCEYRRKFYERRWNIKLISPED